MRPPRITLRFAPVLLALAACSDPPRPDAKEQQKDDALVEPDVFDVIRASNSKQAIERLRDRYHEETEHAKLLQVRIDEAVAAEEGLAAEQRQRLDSLQKIRDEVRTLVEQNAALERQLNAELARRDELKKKVDQAQQENAAAAKAAGKEEAPPPGAPAPAKPPDKDAAKPADGKKDGG
jgi:predicted RNase H-like nuclease (RuvC/YqgF family)